MADPFVLSFGPAAFRTFVADYSRVTTNRVTIYGVVDRTITDTDFLHISYDLFKGGKVVERITVKLDIADVTCIGQSMIRSLLF